MKFTDAVKSGVLLGDGAMGTQLQALGLKPGESSALWNLTEPGKVLQVQQSYVKAGAELLISNSFTASRIALETAGLADRVEEINRAAVSIAREAFGGSPGFVLGDLGPFGGMMEPYGSVTRDEVFVSYLEQAEFLLSAGVDALIIETQTSLEEMGTALDAVKKAGAPCVIASMSFDSVKNGSDFRTMMGVSPEDAVQLMVDRGADVIGTNCGTGIDIGNAARITSRYRKACGLPIMAQPNAGQPEREGSSIIYKETPEQMAAGIDFLIDAGASIIGSCCGTTPVHTAQFRVKLDARK